MKEELTKSEIVAYYRGKFSEYIRHEVITEEERRALFQWVNAGHDVHDNPWGLRNRNFSFNMDYIEAYRITK